MGKSVYPARIAYRTEVTVWNKLCLIHARKRPSKASGRCYVKTDKRENFRYRVKNKKSHIDRDLVILSLPLLLPVLSLIILFIFSLLLPR